MILKEASNNPFRILGLYSDCTLKQQAANLSKLQAFATVQKQTDMPSDMTKIYGPADRSASSLKQADEQLRNADERLLAALLWWPEPTEPWMQSVMERAGKTRKDKLPEIPQGLDEKSRMRALLTLLQACILQKQWDVLSDTLDNIAKNLDALKELAHCSTSTADGSQIQQYVYGLLERDGVPIRTISITQRIAYLTKNVTGIDNFRTLQLLYYQLEEVTSDAKQLQQTSDSIALWVVRNSNDVRQKQLDDIKRILKESFQCSSGIMERLDNVSGVMSVSEFLEKSRAERRTQFYNKKDNNNGCIYFYFICQFLFAIFFLRTCIGSKHKTSSPHHQPNLLQEYYEQKANDLINEGLYKLLEKGDSAINAEARYEMIGINVPTTETPEVISSTTDAPEIVVLPENDGDEHNTEDNYTTE